MFISILLILVALVVVITVKAQFDRLPVATRNLALALAAVLTGSVVTVELFIYGERRMREFLHAVERVPWIVVVAAFVLAVALFFWLFRFIARLNLENIKRFYREHAKPLVSEVTRDVRAAWRGISWRRFFSPSRFRRRSSKSDDALRDRREE